jgi:hypothetical protein
MIGELVVAIAAGLGVAEPRPASAVNVTLKAEPPGTTPSLSHQDRALQCDQHAGGQDIAVTSPLDRLGGDLACTALSAASRRPQIRPVARGIVVT